jgi:hypothetical protein
MNKATKNKWDVSYNGQTIRVDLSGYEQRLFVDEELQDAFSGFGFRSRLYGKIRDGDAAGEEIRVSVFCNFWGRLICIVFVDSRLVFHSNPDSIAAQSIENNTTS